MSPLYAHALALAAATLLAAARADVGKSVGSGMSRSVYSASVVRSFDPASLLSGCLYEGRWYASGALVPTRAACLRCTCTRSALVCRRRACKPLPDSLPKRCQIKHTRDSCCPELHCPEGVTKTEREEIDSGDAPSSTSIRQACVEGGTLYAGGSAMASTMACEQCFCLKGSKQCVSPTCLPPPPHCVPRPTAGACCPQRYYCEHFTVQEEQYDCEVDGILVNEGDRVMSENNCTACFCLKGEVRCQELGCAPPLQGCEPVLRPGECCAHQYKCEPLKKGWSGSRQKFDESETEPAIRLRPGSGSTKLYISKYPYSQTQPESYETVPTPVHDQGIDPQTWMAIGDTATEKRFTPGRTSFTVRKSHLASAMKEAVAANKVKRKTDDFPVNATIEEINDNNTVTTTSEKPSIAKVTAAMTELTTERTTEQPESIVKIVINGTINCTAELSSTSLPLSISANDTEKIQMEAMPRVPIVNIIEAQTYSPNDIITDRSVNGDFDENDTFTINVTSSLNANMNSTARPVMTTAASKVAMPVELVEAVNSSKKTKGDYDYDYTEPTLPPSLPNLKIIPFVAADAVLEDETSKEPLTYPILEREDKFPVYYPTNTKDTAFTRREDIYQPTQYPVFASDKESTYAHDVDLTSNRYPVQNELVHEYTVSTSLGSHVNEGKGVTKAPLASSTFELQTPVVNLFSPPVETEGGFIPKGPGIIDEYYAVYPSTPPGPAVPHLTTSMQLDISKGECTTDDGTHIPDGETVTVDCRDCFCTWGRLTCVKVPCQAPAGCEFKTITDESLDKCCGDIVCQTENKITTTTVAPVTEKPKANETKPEETMNNTTTAPDESSQFTNAPELTTSSPVNITTVKIQDVSTVKAPTRTSTYGAPKLNTTRANMNDESVKIATRTSTAKPIKQTTVITTTPPPVKHTNDTEYEDEEDEGFSFGSVLQLLLSDTYDATTTKKPKITKPTKPPVPITTTRRPQSTVTSFKPASTVNPFIPLPSAFFPPKMSPSSVNRIDHLVLGEATAIKRTTPRPITNKTTQRPTERVTERTESDVAFTSGPRPPNLSNLPGPGLSGVGAGILKLAGCNIYGRMYRVGRIIAELSTPCQECWCTELGVQCKPLGC